MNTRRPADSTRADWLARAQRDDFHGVGVRVVDLYSDEVRQYAGSTDEVRRQVLRDYPFAAHLRDPNTATLCDLVVTIARCQAYNVEVIVKQDDGKLKVGDEAFASECLSRWTPTVATTSLLAQLQSPSPSTHTVPPSAVYRRLLGLGATGVRVHEAGARPLIRTGALDEAEDAIRRLAACGGDRDLVGDLRAQLAFARRRARGPGGAA